MENNAPWQTPRATKLPESLRSRLTGHALVDGDRGIRIVAAAPLNWPELTYIATGDVALGDDGFIRCALWSASKCCATLLGARRATLLVTEGDTAWEVRCFVLANASLTTARPLSGFLLKPVEILDGHVSRNAPGLWGAHRTLTDIQNRAGDSRLALFDAFPVSQDGENAPPGGGDLPP